MNNIEALKKMLFLEKKRYGLKEEISTKEINQLISGMPFQKIMGYIDYDDLKIEVKNKVLIPRYETQELVNFVIKKILKNKKKNINVLDLCCGSGYIGLTIKQKINKIKIVLSDISNEAIIQSTINARKNNLNVKIIKSNLFNNIKNKFDFIISNPPYIKEETTLDKSVTKFEPKKALFAKDNGNHFYKRILNQYKKYLNKGGYIFFEIGIDNVSFFEKLNKFTILKDINGKKRYCFFKFIK